MSQSFDIAVIGATSLVGEALFELLDEHELPPGELIPLSAEEAGSAVVTCRGRNLRVRDLYAFDFTSTALVLALEPLAAAQRERILAAGCRLVELAGGSEAAPCVLATVNPQALAAQVRSPLPAVAALAGVLAALTGVLELQRLTVTACLAVSGRGREGVEELARQTALLLNARPLEPGLFGRQIAFNLLAASGAPGAGSSDDEQRLVTELREVLERPALPVSATCVQAPVFFGDSLSVSLLCAAPVSLAAVEAALEAAGDIELCAADDWPTAVGDAVGQERIHVGRLRVAADDPCRLDLWVVADNVRQGAALNAVRLAGLLLKPNP